MTATLSLTNSEVSVLASALRRQGEHLLLLRRNAEVALAQGHISQYVDWAHVAASEERDLAAIDSLVGKLPEWVGVFMERAL